MRRHQSEWEPRQVLGICVNDQIRPIPGDSSQGLDPPHVPSHRLLTPPVCLLIIPCWVTPHFLEEQRSGWPCLHQKAG